MQLAAWASGLEISAVYMDDTGCENYACAGCTLQNPAKQALIKVMKH